MLLGLMGTAGNLSIYFVLPQMGAIFDRTKVAIAGGDWPSRRWRPRGVRNWSECWVSLPSIVPVCGHFDRRLADCFRGALEAEFLAQTVDQKALCGEMQVGAIREHDKGGRSDGALGVM